MSDAFQTALARIMRPLARAMISRGLRFSDAAEILKRAFVEAAERDFQLDGKRLTDSRVSLLTGLQRRDVRVFREETTSSKLQGAGQLPRVIARWLADPAYRNSDDGPATLPRAGPRPSFESLARDVSKDLHPRTVLDELARLGAIAWDEDEDRVTLIRDAFTPSEDEEALLSYFGANLGDHVEAATANLSAAPEFGPFLERAVHYNQLTKDSVDALERMSRELQTETLAKINSTALRLQDADAEGGGGAHRFRCGAYVFREEADQQKEGKE